MKASVWITTYRRVEVLERHLDSLRLCPFQVNVIVPNDELDVHPMREGVRYYVAPENVSGKGAGAARAYLGYLVPKDDEFFVVLDDDIIWSQNGKEIEEMVTSLANQPSLATVQPRFGFPPARLLDETVGVGGNLAAAVAIRASAYRQVGGYDLRLWRKEDEDLSIRLRLAGWLLGKSVRTRCNHVWGQPGGMAAFEKSGDLTYEEALRISNTAAQTYVFTKYPEGLLTRLDAGKLRVRPKKLKELQALYAEGLLTIDTNGARMKERPA